MMLHTKYQGSRPCGLRQDFLKFSSQKSIFSLCDLDMHMTITISTIIKEGHIRIIPDKFGKKSSHLFRRRCPLQQLLTFRRHTSTFTIAHHEPMVQVS